MPEDGIEGPGSGSNTGLYSLKWNSFQTHLSKGLKSLLEDDEFTDITLAAEGGYLKAHKFHLSMCSPFFKRLLRANTRDNSNTIVILNNVPFRDLENIIRFIYYGEVNINQADLRSFLNTGELLQIEGLSNVSNSQTTTESQENQIHPHPIANNSTPVGAGSNNSFAIDSPKIVGSEGRRFSRSESLTPGNKGRPPGKAQSKRARGILSEPPKATSHLNSGPSLRTLTPISQTESLIYCEPPIKSRKSTLRQGQGASTTLVDPLNIDSYEIERRNEESMIIPQSSIKIEMTESTFNPDSSFLDESHGSYKGDEIPGTSSAPNATQTKQSAAQEFQSKLRHLRSLLNPNDKVETSDKIKEEKEEESSSNSAKPNEPCDSVEDANSTDFDYGYQFTPVTSLHVLPNAPVTSVDTPVICPFCGKHYKNKNSLKVHRSMVHRGLHKEVKFSNL